MANLIKCPNCGENNPADQEFCQYCRSRLQPPNANPSGEEKPLTPGQAPTQKSTAELEPILPQWLRDARESSRLSAPQEDAPQQPPRPASPAPLAASDLLAGLQSQTEDDEEEVPDWLKNITGETASKPKPSPVETPDGRRVELGGEKDFTQSEPEPDVPSWLSGMASSAPSAGEGDDLASWARAADASQDSHQFPSDQQPPSPDETRDWLHSMVSDDSAVFDDSAGAADESFISSDTPDWLRGLEAPASSGGSGSAPAFSDTPDWLKAMEAENAALKPAAPSDASSDTPDWLKTMRAENVPASSSDSDMPDWLNAIQEQGKALDAQPAISAGMGLDDSKPAPPMEQEPDWLKSFQSEEEKQPVTPETLVQQPAAADDTDLDIPNWLKASAPQSSIFSEPSAEEPVPAPDVFETPEWLNAFKSTDASGAQPAQGESSKKPESLVPPVPVGQPAADSDSLFTEMPDWLSITDDTIAPESTPAPITNVDAIAPGDLPSWVQAMRPVDAGMPVSLSGYRTMETQGALAGLQGVLPTAPGLVSVKKPKAHSIKLRASAEQQQNADLLLQILSAETEPVPLESSFAPGGTSRGLRWLLAFLVFAALAAVLVMRTQVFASPAGFPIEAVSAWNIVKDSIPTDGRVLVVFDYEPARAGEIESIAVPMFDQMIRMRYPRLTFVSTNETGLVLAERFIKSGSLAELNYQSGSQYLNLGYLPGGGMGIRAFAENPFATLQYAAPQTRNLFDFNPELAKAFPPIEGVDSFSQFSALFLLTDNADSARAWIEQTTSVRGAMPFVVISSAQAAPMLQPYYASGQINGLAGGLYGGALFEQNDLDQDGRKLSNTVRMYWDAYSAGMLLAMALILGGGLISLALGLRDRIAAGKAG